MEGNNKEVIGEKSLNEKLNFSQLVPFGGSLVFLPPIEETEKGQHLPWNSLDFPVYIYIKLSYYIISNLINKKYWYKTHVISFLHVCTNSL